MLCGAAVDHFVFVSDEELVNLVGSKNDWEPISKSQFLELIEGKDFISHSGGSGINLAKGVNSLGKRCAILSQVGTDEKGGDFIAALQAEGIQTHIKQTDFSTAGCVCFITPDKERTMRTFQGSPPNAKFELDEKLFIEAKHLHIEGYLLGEEILCLKALNLAKKHGLTISIDLANTFIVQKQKDFILKILDEYANLVLCNDLEARALFGKRARGSISEFLKYVDTAVVTMGADGSFTGSKDQVVYTPAFEVSPKEVTGAGDLFASGFLASYLDEKPLGECAKLGSLVASIVIQCVGAEIPQEHWELIFKEQT
ncbi:MAG: putative sugar kinase YdjH [Chlamydiia bacterium]|nr:putative sugar kinase YdjH [Chlamydiia bacterium]MCH9615626.1 putative sugar kinase YdjH [Chlamydiia bacterium]MCH9628971.1 putative sugar kinase YdjH [Chlamydiia bacterium]